jgi:hypothetical protein
MSVRKKVISMSGTKHAQKWVVIGGERVKIDIIILPLVNWLNTRPSVKTAYCCAGGNGIDCWVPYVSFYASQKESRKIERIVSEFFHQYGLDMSFETSYNRFCGKRYRMGFSSRQVLKSFMRFIAS